MLSPFDRSRTNVVAGDRSSRFLPVTQPPQAATAPLADITPFQTSDPSPDDAADTRRASDLSERTLYDQTEEEMQRSLKRVSLSSYQHPNDIAPPGNVYFSGVGPRPSAKRRFGHRQSLDDGDRRSHSRDEGALLSSPHDIGPDAPRHHGVVSNLLELSRVSSSTPKWDNPWFSPSRSGSISESGPDMRPRLSRLYSLGGYDADDPRITGATRELLDDPADLERNVKDQMALRSMSYKQRRKEAQKIKIRFFVTCASSRTLRRPSANLCESLPQSPAVHHEARACAHDIRRPFAPHRVSARRRRAHPRSRRRVYPPPQHLPFVLRGPGDVHVRDALHQVLWSPRARQPQDGASDLPPGAPRRDQREASLR